jgi:starch-binding outer membrane protein, SusD/RagB family
MKNLLIILFISIILFSCKDLLEENPKLLASETFYNTQEEVTTALNAIYSPLRIGNCLGGLFPAQLEAYSDYGYGRGSYTLVSQFQGLDDTNIGRAGSMWNLFYMSIRNANLVISRVPDAEFLTDAQKNNAIGEAKFLRGLSYLLMVQNWGRIPLRTENNMSEMNVPRASENDVWNLIETDLRFAADNLPDKARAAGTPSKWAAKTVLTQCLLYQQKYDEAKLIAESVIESGQYSLLNISQPDDYLTIYGADIVTTKEEIFYLKYSRKSDQGWEFVQFPHHPGAGYISGFGYFALISDTKIKTISEWDNDDFRKTYNWYSYNIGVGNTTILNRKYRDYNAPSRLSLGNDFPLYRYADLLLWYAELEGRTNNGASLKGVEALNMTRRRAYGFVFDQQSPVDLKVSDFTSLQQFLDAVIKERGYETCYEAKRWLDLKRLGIAKKVIKDVYNIDVAEKHMLWPIPLSEMNYNKALNPTTDQNPGY